MEEALGTHCVSADENDSVVVQTEPSSSLAGENGSEAHNAGDPLAESSDVLAKGLSSMLSTVIRDFDFRAQQTLLSQHHLSSSVDRLTGGLSLSLSISFLVIVQHCAEVWISTNFVICFCDIYIIKYQN